MWFDILATFGIIVPLFFRERFPFYAPAASGVVFALGSFVDERWIPGGLIPFLTAVSVFVLFGLIRDRTQAIAGLAVGIGVAAVVTHNDPKSSIGNFLFSSAAFTIAWTIGFGARSQVPRDRAGEGASRPGRARAAGACAPRRRRRAHAHRT